MTTGRTDAEAEIRIRDKKLEQVEKCAYLKELVGRGGIMKMT